MKHLADDKPSQPKEKIVSIRISSRQGEIFTAAMRREGIPFLSRFARTAMLELADRIFRPVDYTTTKPERDLVEQRTRLKRKIQTLELDLAAGPESLNRGQVAELTELARSLLRTLEATKQRRP